MKIPQEVKDKLSRWFTEDEMDAEIYICKWLPVGGITIGNHILLKKNLDSITGLSILGHELVHVQQYKELGIWGFLSRWFITDRVSLEIARQVQWEIICAWCKESKGEG